VKYLHQLQRMVGQTSPVPPRLDVKVEHFTPRRGQRPPASAAIVTMLQITEAGQKAIAD
jgi:hypothetical protein